MPYPNEHACRVRQPGDFEEESFRRQTRDHKGKKYAVIMGRLKGETTMTEQAYRYAKDAWDADAARAHCKAHDGSFEAASGKENAPVINAEIPAEVPEWVMLVRTGAWLGHPQGPEVISPDHLRSAHEYFQRHYKAHGADLAIDYHHGSVLAALGKVSQAPAAGWIMDTQLRAEDTELWGHVQPWVAEARTAIAARQFRYLSPVLLFGKPDRVTGESVPMYVHSMALTNVPFLTEMEALNENAVIGGGDPTGPTGAGPSDEGGESMGLIAALAKALGIQPEEAASRLGLDAGAEDKAVADALVANAAKVTELEAKVKGPAPVVNDAIAGMLGVKADSEEKDVKAALIALQAGGDLGPIKGKLGLKPEAGVQEVLNTLDGLQETRHRQDAETLIDEAVMAGKVPPAQRDFYLKTALDDLEATRMVLNAAPIITALAHRPPQAITGGGQLTADDQQLCKTLGISKETFLLGA